MSSSRTCVESSRRTGSRASCTPSAAPGTSSARRAMNRLERVLAALTPKRWPVRWRLAAVSATLTLIILVVFAVVVGRLTTNRLQGDFDQELRDTATRLAFEVQLTQPVTVPGHLESRLVSPDPREMATITGTGAVRVLSANGTICAAPG